MTRQRERAEPEQPVGIVIAGEARGDVTPRFAAFVWGPAPDEDVRQQAPEAKAA